METASLGRHPERKSWTMLFLILAGLLLLVMMALVLPGYLPGETQNDIDFQHWPAADFLRQSVLQQGVFPLWNPTRMLGQPFAANPLNKVWYPPQWLVLVLPPTVHLNVMLYGHTILMVFGVFAWAKVAKYRLYAALLMTVALTLNTKLLAHLGAGHADVYYAIAWVPLLIATIYLTITSKKINHFVALSLVAGMLTLADLRIAVLFLAASSLLAAGNLFQIKERLRVLIGWGVAAFAYLLLILVIVAPLLQLAPYMTRTEITPQLAAVFSLRPEVILSGLLIGPTTRFHELTVYVGMPVLVLATIALWKRRSFDVAIRREILLWALIGIIAALWSLGDKGPLFQPATTLVPALTFFRVPSRAWFVVTVSLIALSGRGLDYLVTRTLPGWGRLAAFACVISGLTWVVGAFIGLPNADRGVFLIGLSLALMGAAFLLIAFATNPKVRVLAFPAAVGLSLLYAGSLVLTSRPLKTFTTEQTEILSQLAAENSDCSRVLALDHELNGVGFSVNDTWALNGIDPFQLSAAVNYIQAAAGYPRHGYSVPVPSVRTEDEEIAPASELLLAANVTGVVSQQSLVLEGYTRIGTYGDLNLYVADASGPIACEQNPNRLNASSVAQTRTLNRLELLLPWVPGWIAEYDDTRIEVSSNEAGFATLAVPDEVAPEEITLIYRPWLQIVAAAVSGLTLVALLCIWLLLLRKQSSQ